MDQRDVAHLLASAAVEINTVPREQPTFEAVVTQAVALLPSADEASITVHSPRRGYVTLAATSDGARDADQQQYLLREGPCVEAADGQDSLRSGDVRTDHRWPRWGPAAAALGIGSLLSIGLTAQERRIGALNLYAAAPGAFVERDEVELAILFAVHAAQALSAARMVSGLEVALTSRHHIGVAQGMIMERYGVGLDQSFAILLRISSQTEVKVALVARQIVETREVPTVG